MKKIKIKRVEKDVKQKEMADRLGISQQYLRKIEKGDVSPRVDLVRAIADILNVSIHDLID